MKDNYKILNIFPTAGYVTKLSDDIVSPHIELLNSEPYRPEPEDQPLTHGLRSLDSYLFNSPKYKILANSILEHSTNFAENTLLLDYKNYKFSQSWISVKNSQDSHYPHTHPFSLISGVLFYGDHSDYPALSFTKFPQEATAYYSHAHKPHLQNEFTSSEFKVNYTPNLLVLFPSTLAHSVDVNTSQTPRKSLAFNIIPRDGFGREDTLTELKFN